jgi:hypothetical protein
MRSDVQPEIGAAASEPRPVSVSPPPLTRGQRFLATRTWLVLKNLIGWVLILAAFVAGPLVPGPGGLPLFLIGFALISFPGKRRLTARVLRGRPVQFQPAPFALICAGTALIAPALVLLVVRHRPRWFARTRTGAFTHGPVAVAALYLILGAVVWVLVRLTPHVLNMLLRITARARRKFRPWLRHHRIRLLPPRWRTRRLHEAGRGPFRLKDEILRFSKKRHQSD